MKRFFLNVGMWLVVLILGVGLLLGYATAWAQSKTGALAQQIQGTWTLVSAVNEQEGKKTDVYEVQIRALVNLADLRADNGALAALIEKLVGQAIQDLVKMRKKEGALLAADIRTRIETLRGLKAQVAVKAPSVAQEAFDRMKSRLEKLLTAEIPDAAKLHQELAVFADRSDITEELVRLDAHMIQFDQTLQSSESVGKTLDFLLQEMGREVNTIGSKANDATITASVVQMKAELERIREQIQNVE